MNFFPTKKYTFSLIDTDDKSIERLKRRTYNSDSLISKTTDKSFIGIINVNDFKVISSERGIGAFCILDGEIKKLLIFLQSKSTLEFSIDLRSTSTDKGQGRSVWWLLLRFNCFKIFSKIT